jgi:hypothetical protein
VAPVHCHKDITSFAFLESKVIVKSDTKWRQRCQAFPVFSWFVGSSKESVLFSKSNLSSSYNITCIFKGTTNTTAFNLVPLVKSNSWCTELDVRSSHICCSSGAEPPWNPRDKQSTIVTRGQVRDCHSFPVSMQNHRSLRSTDMKSISRCLTRQKFQQGFTLVWQNKV